MDLIKEKRARYLKNLIKEAVLNILVEQENMSSIPPATPQPSPNTNAQDPSVQQPRATAPQRQEVFDVDQMIEKLNILRGGKSFNDPEIYGRLTTFFKGLSDEQKTNLDFSLSELGKIIFSATESDAGIDHNPPQQSNGTSSGQISQTAPTPSPAQTTAPAAPGI